jgi:hypothetical protein
VLPEGNLPESQLLFHFAMRAAALLPDYRFIFRCHPILPFDRVRSRLHDFPERFANITVSAHTPITADFDRSSLLLYRGSSAVLHAVLHGLKPVYLHDDRSPDIDPLFEVTNWRERIASLREMQEVLERYAAVSQAHAAEQWRRAAEYAEAYTVPVDGAAIDRFLTAVGFSQARPLGPMDGRPVERRG